MKVEWPSVMGQTTPSISNLEQRKSGVTWWESQFYLAFSYGAFLKFVRPTFFFKTGKLNSRLSVTICPLELRGMECRQTAYPISTLASKFDTVHQSTEISFARQGSVSCLLKRETDINLCETKFCQRLHRSNYPLILGRCLSEFHLRSMLLT